MLYADAKEWDTNEDRMLSSTELSLQYHEGFGAQPIDSTTGWRYVDKRDAHGAITAFADEWVSQWGHGLWTSGEEIFSIAMRTERGQFLYSEIAKGTFSEDPSYDYVILMNSVFYMASAADYYNTVNTLSYLADEIAPFWN